MAELLNLPLIYVRAKPKDHGAGRQIEGVLKPGQKVVMLDDLISTGGSVLQAAKAVQAAGGDIQAVGAIFSYALMRQRKTLLLRHYRCSVCPTILN